MSHRVCFIIGNWKMHMTVKETTVFVKELLPHLKNVSCKVGIAPPFTSIGRAAHEAQGSPLLVGAQNMSEYPQGAYTGEVSSVMLKESGASFVLLGHSERRAYFHEDDLMVGRKVKRALIEGLDPILCVGETQGERDHHQTEEVLTRQLDAGLKGCLSREVERLMIAYEPVWAIGTGKTATPEIAQETHHFIRSLIKGKWGEAVAERISILYGGSVKPDNAQILFDQPDIDGALVGGAALQVETFAKIIKCIGIQ